MEESKSLKDDSKVNNLRINISSSKKLSKIGPERVKGLNKSISHISSLKGTRNANNTIDSSPRTINKPQSFINEQDVLVERAYSKYMKIQEAGMTLQRRLVQLDALGYSQGNRSGHGIISRNICPPTKGATDNLPNLEIGRSLPRSQKSPQEIRRYVPRSQDSPIGQERNAEKKMGSLTQRVNDNKMEIEEEIMKDNSFEEEKEFCNMLQGKGGTILLPQIDSKPQMLETKLSKYTLISKKTRKFKPSRSLEHLRNFQGAGNIPKANGMRNSTILGPYMKSLHTKSYAKFKIPSHLKYQRKPSEEIIKKFYKEYNVKGAQSMRLGKSVHIKPQLDGSGLMPELGLKFY